MTVKELRAWGVHLFTMSGAVCGFLALANIVENDPKDAMWWLMLALLIDGVDGTFARKFEVTEHLPNVDGVTIDNIVDYFTYVVVPAFYIWWIPDVVPDGWAIPAVIAILMSSQYHFSDLRHKTHDNYFRGFPALWNLVIFGFFVFQPPPWMALVFIGFFALTTFVPLKFVHPFRVEKLRKTNLALASIGAVALIVAIWTYPDPSLVAKVILIGVAIWYLVLGIGRTWDDRPSKT